MTPPVRPPPPPPAAAIWPIATGLLAVALGFLAAVAQGMASAPTPWAGLVPMAIMAAGAALTVLGLVSIAVPGMRAAGRRCAIAALIGFVGLYAVSQILMRAGAYDG